jgi:hypothetical protein
MKKIVDFDVPLAGPELPPGAPEVLARGCRCDPVKNKNGKGVAVPGRPGPLYRADSDCPMHGLAAINDLLKKHKPS